MVDAPREGRRPVSLSEKPETTNGRRRAGDNPRHIRTAAALACLACLACLPACLSGGRASEQGGTAPDGNNPPPPPDGGNFTIWTEAPPDFCRRQVAGGQATRLPACRARAVINCAAAPLPARKRRRRRKRWFMRRSVSSPKTRAEPRVCSPRQTGGLTGGSLED